jgi:hypothetical protein
VADGGIVGGSASGAPHASGAVDYVFELLRFTDGEFVFEDGTSPAEASPPTDVESVLMDAEKLVAEWKDIEQVVPSSAAWVSLSPELPGDEVSITKDRWNAIVAVGGGATVSSLGDTLELGELQIARLVKELTEEGLTKVGDAPAGASAEPAPTISAAPEPSPMPGEASEISLPADRFDPNALVIEEPKLAPAPEPEPEAEPEPAAAGGGGLAEMMAQAEPGEAAEIARQLANLSPKAARAVAAAAKATTEEERNAALAEVEEGDDQINRDLLLKFLGPSKG